MLISLGWFVDDKIGAGEIAQCAAILRRRIAHLRYLLAFMQPNRNAQAFLRKAAIAEQVAQKPGIEGKLSGWRVFHGAMLGDIASAQIPYWTRCKLFCGHDALLPSAIAHLPKVVIARLGAAAIAHAHAIDAPLSLREYP